jgi:hypothetical protein
MVIKSKQVIVLFFLVIKFMSEGCSHKKVEMDEKNKNCESNILHEYFSINKDGYNAIDKFSLNEILEKNTFDSCIYIFFTERYREINDAILVSKIKINKSPQHIHTRRYYHDILPHPQYRYNYYAFLKQHPIKQASPYYYIEENINTSMSKQFKTYFNSVNSNFKEADLATAKGLHNRTRFIFVIKKGNCIFTKVFSSQLPKDEAKIIHYIQNTGEMLGFAFKYKIQTDDHVSVFIEHPKESILKGYERE